MIQQSFLDDMASYGASKLKNVAKVTVNRNNVDSVIDIPCTINNEGNNINVSFIVDNTVQGTLKSIQLTDSANNPVEIVTINYVKTLGTIFVGAFKFTYREGERT